MQYGHFDNDKKEYVIQRPDTPLPWINYLGIDQFFGMISNTGGGYTFMVDARKQRLTRYRYNNVPVDDGGRYFYLRDESNGDVWSPGWKPVRAELDFYECRHGLGYTILNSKRNGVEAHIRFFVPLNQTLEIWELDIVNESTERKELKLFSLVEFCGWEALMDYTNLQRNLNLGEVEVVDNTIYHTTEYRERRNHFAYFAVSEDPYGYDTDLDAFLGPYRGFHDPLTVANGEPQNSIASGWSPCGSHCLKIVLEPGESKTVNYVLGFHENSVDDKFESNGSINKKNVLPIIETYLDREKSLASFAEMNDYWNSMLANLQVSTPDMKLNTMVNVWNQYQCIRTFQMSRSASFFETGIGRGIGFRDACQDIYGIVHLLPKETIRQRILDLAAIQWRDGACYHQYSLLDKKGNAEVGVGFNDDPLWLILATSAYIKETGDWDILDELAEFDNDPHDKAPLYEHLKISFDYIVKYCGPHKLPLIGRADWNDCLNLNLMETKPGDTFQADAVHASLDDDVGRIPESLMIAAQFIWAGKEFEMLARRKNDQIIADKIAAETEQMLNAIYEAGWDGDWFLRAYDRFGNKIGSKECKEGKIYIEPQAMMGIAEVGLNDGKLEKAMNSLEKHLFTKHGVMVHQPAYTKYSQYIGEISSYPPGVKENSGIFCHPNGWVVIAECNLGRGDKAMQYYRAISPAYREEISDVHRCEPYVYCQMIAGSDSPRFGEGKNSWLTGTASANFLGVSQYLLGIKPDYDGLRIDPCIPPRWESFEISRTFRGATYQIQVLNPEHVSRGVKSIVVDGKEITGNLIPAFTDGNVHIININMGKI